MLKSHKKSILDTLGRSPVHPFPARMAPGIALDALGSAKRKLRVLDPMAGSGTVLAVARRSGHQAYGFDLDPLAVLLSQVWTDPLNTEEVCEKAAQVLECAKQEFQRLRVADAYPTDADGETKEFIRYWFDDYARRQLTALCRSIQRVRNTAVQRALWCAFSRLIITKSSGASLAMDLSHSRPHRAFKRAPAKPFSKFLTAVKTVTRNCPQKGTKAVGPKVTMKLGDARDIHMPDCSIDLVLTSPPYLNAIDYMRCSKFSLVWMGYNLKDLRSIRGKTVGAEASSETAGKSELAKQVADSLSLKPALPARDQAILYRYICDMDRSVAEASRVLRPSGRAVYVVGDSTVRGAFVRNSRIIEAVAKCNGLVLTKRVSRTLPANRRYLPPPQKTGSSAPLDARMRTEVVLVFKKRVSRSCAQGRTTT